MRDTVWLLDVDGVLNVTRPGWGAAPRNGTAFGGGHPFRMRWAPALITRIRDADQVERLCGLPRLERAWTDPIGHAEAPAAKLAAARAVLAGGHRLIWTDDDAVPTAGPEHDELTGGGRALLIAPVPTRGLQPEHLDAIEAFASGPAQP